VGKYFAPDDAVLFPYLDDRGSSANRLQADWIPNSGIDLSWALPAIPARGV